MSSLQHLLPGPDESVRCAEHTRTLAIDPGGTSIRADRLVLIPTPLPWPKPVFDHPWLVEVDPILKRSAMPTRTLASVDDGPADRPSIVTTFDRPVGGERAVTERRFAVDSARRLVEIATALAGDDVAAVQALADDERPLDDQVLLVCTQGSHDVCCGSEGARFAAEAQSVPGLRIHRVSHTGGHRFAPTAMTLPDGRMWADLDLDLLRQILARTGNTDDVVDRCRGWWGAETGPAQVAERAVFERVGWSLEELDRTVTVETIDDRTALCRVVVDDRTWTVTVGVGRTVPTIACRQPGGLPAKTASEYTVLGITEPHRSRT